MIDIYSKYYFKNYMFFKYFCYIFRFYIHHIKIILFIRRNIFSFKFSLFVLYCHLLEYFDFTVNILQWNLFVLISWKNSNCFFFSYKSYRNKILKITTWKLLWVYWLIQVLNQLLLKNFEMLTLAERLFYERNAPYKGFVNIKIN